MNNEETITKTRISEEISNTSYREGYAKGIDDLLEQVMNCPMIR